MRLASLQSLLPFFVFGVWLSTAPAAPAEDWPMWGRDKTRNLVSPEKNPPTDWQAERKDRKTGQVVKVARNIKWSAQLGSVSMGGPVVADGLVWVGTNNYQPRDPNLKQDASVLMCFRESDGKFLWQYVSPRLKSGQANDWPGTSMPAPLIEGERLWLVTNRCETVCFDIGPLRRGEGEPKPVWKVDMIGELGVAPRATAMALPTLCCIGASYKDLIYVVTGNGVDEKHIKVPAPEAPSLVCFHKNTGKVVWKDNSPGKNIMDGQWTSPLVIEVNGRGQVIVGQGDGWLRSFDAETGKLIWKCDLNPKDAKWELGGRGTRNYVVATPVWHDHRVYLATGLHPEHYVGVGGLFCIDPTKEGDISRELETEPGKGKPNPNSGVVWHYGGFIPKEQREKAGRDWYFGWSVSTCVVHDGLVYAAELDGYLHCLDARTGKHHWTHDLKAGVFGSPLWADGKIYLGTEDGDMWIFTHGKEKKEPKRIELDDSIYATPIFANGVLYVMTRSTLYTIQEKK